MFYEKGPLREGIWQMRPALFGWQYRIRGYGLEWEPWTFKFGSYEHVRDVTQDQLGEKFVLQETKGDP